jgi:hypothetical protein
MVQTASDAQIFPITNLDSRSLGMHLYRTYQNVMAVREEMWDCLEQQRVLANSGTVPGLKDELEEAGWEEEPPNSSTGSARDKFDGMMEKYARCVSSSFLSWNRPDADNPH